MVKIYCQYLRGFFKVSCSYPPSFIGMSRFSWNSKSRGNAAGEVVEDVGIKCAPGSMYIQLRWGPKPCNRSTLHKDQRLCICPSVKKKNDNQEHNVCLPTLSKLAHVVLGVLPGGRQKAGQSALCVSITRSRLSNLSSFTAQSEPRSHPESAHISFERTGSSCLVEGSKTSSSTTRY